MSARRLALVAAGAVTAGALWWRKHPSACPYSQRFWVEPPHPFITRARLRDVLDPKPGERLLEVGPGTSYYALPVAEWLGSSGRLDVFDIQQEMLDHTMRRAAAGGLANVVPTRGDARSLTYDDDSFDGACLVAVLGEITDQDAALRELARVIRPGGRLVVGEIFGDPHWSRPRRCAGAHSSPASASTPGPDAPWATTCDSRSRLARRPGTSVRATR